MNDLVSRQALLDKFGQWQKTEDYNNGEWNLLVDVLNVIQSMPPAPQLSTSLAEVGTDCISRQAAIDALGEKPLAWEQGEYEEGLQTQWESDVEAIKALLSAEPKRGKWIRTGSGSLYDHYECSECGKAPKWECMGDNRWKIAFTNFCPNCGADMREVTT